MASVCCIIVVFAHACVFNSLEVNPTDNGTTSFSSLGSVGGWVGGPSVVLLTLLGGCLCPDLLTGWNMCGL